MKPIKGLCLAMLLASCSADPPPVEKDARQAFEAYVQALNAGDVDAAANMYDSGDGFHWIERGGVQYETGADAAASLRALQAAGSSQMTITDIRVADLAEGSALVSAAFEFEMLSANGEPQFSFDGWMTVGMVKRAGGWKIAGGQTGPGRDD